MTPEDAAELGLYASELFRFVQAGQKTAVAELMLPVCDMTDENHETVTTALDVGKSLLRSIAATATDEQRLDLSEVRRVVGIHQRMWAEPPPDTDQKRRTDELRAATLAVKQGDSIQQWAAGLSTEDEQSLRDEAMRTIKEPAQFLFAGKTLCTSTTLRLLAYEHHKKLHAFD